MFLIITVWPGTKWLNVATQDLKALQFSLDLNIKVFKYQGKIRLRCQFVPVTIVLYGPTWQLKLYSGVSLLYFWRLFLFPFFFFFKHTTILSKNLQYLLFTTAEKFFINLKEFWRTSSWRWMYLNSSLMLWGIDVSSFYTCNIIIHCFFVFMVRNVISNFD